MTKRRFINRIIGAFFFSLSLLAAGHAFPALALAAVEPAPIDFHHDSVPHSQTSHHISCIEDFHEVMSRSVEQVQTVDFCVAPFSFAYVYPPLFNASEPFSDTQEKPPLPHPLESKTILRL